MMRLTLVACLACTLVSGAAAQTVTLHLSNEYEASSVHGEGDVRFAALVADRTGGTVEIVVHTDAALGYRSADHFAAVEAGEIAIADSFGGAFGSRDPIFLVSTLPYLAPTVGDARRLLDVTRGAFADRFEERGQILLYASPWPTSGIWSREPVEDAGDLAGLTIRTFDTNGTEVFRRLGADPVELSWVDALAAIAAGEVDAVLTSTESGINARFWASFGNFTGIGGYAIPLNLVHMNRAAFDGLTTEQQDGVLEAARATEAANWDALVARAAADQAKLDEQGVATRTLDAAADLGALREAASAAVDAWLAATGEEGSRLLALYRGTAN